MMRTNFLFKIRMIGTLSLEGAILGLNKNLVLSFIRCMIRCTGMLAYIDVSKMVLKWLSQNQMQKMNSFLICYLVRIVVHKNYHVTGTFKSLCITPKLLLNNRIEHLAWNP